VNKFWIHQEILEVEILDWNAKSSAANARALSLNAGKLSFRVNLGADVIQADYKSYLHKSMSSGIFVAKVVSNAHAVDQSSLASVNFAELLEFNVIHKTNLNTVTSGIASIVVVVGALVGVFVGVLTFRKIATKKASYVALSSTVLQEEVSLPKELRSTQNLHRVLPVMSSHASV